MTGDLVELGIVLVLVLAVGLFGASEIAITKITKVRALRFEREELRGAASLARIAEHPARYLNVMLLLTLVSTIAGSTIATSIAVRRFGETGLAEIIATFVMTLVLFVFADVTPKTFAIQHADRVSLALAPFIVAVTRLVDPIARGLVGLANAILPGKGLKEGPFITEEELRDLAELGVEAATVEAEEADFIDSVFQFGDTVVREIMSPRPDIAALPASASLRDVQALVLERGYSRIPIYDGDLDEPVGIVFAKDVLKALHEARPVASLRDVARPARFVPESKKAGQLLREMRQGTFHIALVTDEYGSVSGLITLEDLLEELVGDIEDEFDKEPAAAPIPQGDDAFLLDGRYPIDDLGEVFEDVEIPVGDWDTVGGAVLGLFGSIPAVGQEITQGELTFRVERLQGRRVSKVLVTRRPVESDGDGTDGDGGNGKSADREDA